MSDTKFTKGDWEAKTGVSSGEDFGLVYIRGGGFDVSKAPDAEANAHLIASAPKMYEMLNRWANSVDCVDDNYQDGLK